MCPVHVKFMSKKTNKIRWLPQKSMFITGSWDDEQNTVCVWDCPNLYAGRDPVENFDIIDPQVITEKKFPGGVTDLKVAGDLIFASSSLGSLVGYKYVDQKLQAHCLWENVHQFPSGPAPITGITIKGNDIASVGEDGRLCIYNFIQKQPVRQIVTADFCSLTAVSYLRHQEIVVGNILGYLKVWDLRSGSDRLSQTLSVSGDQVGVMSMNLHPTQSHILATGHDDGTLCIWDLRHERQPTTLLAGHSSTIAEVLFHPTNPDYLYTCSYDGSIWQWNASPFRTGSSSISLTDSDAKLTTGNPWLNCDASKHKLEIVSLLPKNTSCVNSLDFTGNTLVWSTDNEAVYIMPDINV